MDGRNLHFYELFTSFTKKYPTNYFVIEMQKHGTRFSIDFHYYRLLLLFYFKNTHIRGGQPLTIITKRSILDVVAALDPPLHMIIFIEI